LALKSRCGPADQIQMSFDTTAPEKRRALSKIVAALLIVVVSGALTAGAVAVFSLHLSIRPVLSGSMRPTYAPGWAIVTRPTPTSQVRPGEIIVFTPPGSSAQYAHLVVSVSGPAGHPVITTKGDANRTADPWHLRLHGSTVPTVVAKVPWLGWVMVDFENRWGRVLLIGVLGLGACFGGTRAILRGRSGDQVEGNE
jgi:signal peptidase I